VGFAPPAHLRQKIQVPTVAFAGTDDPVLTLSDYHRAARMFTRGYAVEELPGGHWLHRENPDRFAERVLAHL
jgi:pimeloyl-ACP methyl ester carboxylesterase